MVTISVNSRKPLQTTGQGIDSYNPCQSASMFYESVGTLTNVLQ